MSDVGPEIPQWGRIELEMSYPLTIISTRYGGTYEGGKFVAFPCEEWAIPDDVQGGDVECMAWWDRYAEGVGRGATPDAALADLIERQSLRVESEA